MALSTCGPLVIATWTGPAPHGAVQAQRAADEVRRLRKDTHAKLLLYVYLVGETAVLPEPEARTIRAQLLQYFDTCVGIHEGNSLRASLIRGVVTGMALMSRLGRAKMPHIVSTSEEAARYLAPKAGDQLDEAAILAAIEGTKQLSLQ
ncbi:MAG TPA: hypothetical protein VFS43_37835 [Polyangiaceae bacterium]|nr:hypothetical protein [Polyangiaceae bacterium]